MPVHGTKYTSGQPSTPVIHINNNTTTPKWLWCVNIKYSTRFHEVFVYFSRPIFRILSHSHHLSITLFVSLTFSLPIYLSLSPYLYLSLSILYKQHRVAMFGSIKTLVIKYHRIKSTEVYFEFTSKIVDSLWIIYFVYFTCASGVPVCRVVVNHFIHFL